MRNKIDISEIKIASCSQYDVVGRVFFAKGRVFRAISNEAAEEMRDFLSSPLFTELSQRHWIPQTWITQDVNLPGYAFCMEHEKMVDSHAKEWSFEMMKEAAIFTLRLDALCKKYGYIIKDALFDNVCFHKGKPCWIDIGSFRKIEHGGQPMFQFYYVWNIYLYLSMFSQGADMVARSLLNGWLLEKPFILPDKNPEYIRVIKPFVKKAIWGYDYYIRVRLPHFKLPNWMMPLIWLTDGIRYVINILVRGILRKDNDWDFIKKQPIYKHLTEKDIQKLHASYEKMSMVYPFEDAAILKACKKLVVDDTKVLLFGNFNPNEIEENLKDTECTVISSDSQYVDYSFKQIAERELNINPICTNIFAPIITESAQKNLSGEVVVVGNMLDELQHPTSPAYSIQPPRDYVSIIEHIADYTTKYIIIPNQNEKNEKIICMRFNKMDSIGGYSIYVKKEAGIVLNISEALAGGGK